MKNKENTYIIIFDAKSNFKEIRIVNESSDPFVVGKNSKGNKIYVLTQKNFKELIESAMNHLLEPVGVDNSHDDENDLFANMGQQIILPNGGIGYIKKAPEDYRCDGDGSAEAKAMRAAPTVFGGQVTLPNASSKTLDGNVGNIKDLGSNTGIHIDGPALNFGDDLTDASRKKSQKKK